MKYKALLTGKNNSLIDDFFSQMYDGFEALTTSARYDDIVRHIRYFAPDLFIYCLNNEPRENYNQLISVKFRLREEHIAFVLIGSREDCDEFERIAVNTADLILYKPLSAGAARSRILTFMAKWKPETGETEEIPEEPAVDVPAPAPAPGKSVDLAELFARTEPGEAEDEDAFMERVAAFERMIQKEVQLPAPAAAAEKPAPEPMPPRRRHILVVDDDPMMLKMLKEQLHETYDVATAVSGKIAMRFLERKKTDMILLDYEMPGERGPEVLEKIRRNDSVKDIPVIFLTGVSERGKIQEALALKPQGYLLKPVDRNKLMEIIEKTIGSG